MPLDDDDLDVFGNDEYGEFVPAVFARSRESADKYREVLEDHDIPVVLSDERGDEDTDDELAPPRPGMTNGVAVMVPDALLDEASEIIANREETEDFEEDEEFDDEEDGDFTLGDGFGEADEEDVGIEEEEEDDLFADLDDDDLDEELGEEDDEF
jgi:hypothetical protein